MIVPPFVVESLTELSGHIMTMCTDFVHNAVKIICDIYNYIKYIRDM